MRIQSIFGFHRFWLPSLVLLLFASFALGEQRNNDKYICSESNPESMCTVANTCGSPSVPCTVDIKRTAESASVTPSIPNAKGNVPFCVKSGTTITWKSLSKNTGFVVDFGPSSPFGQQEAIIGGSDRSPSVVVKRQGCYKFSAGACVSGEIYGMCGSVDTELVVVNGGK